LCAGIIGYRALRRANLPPGGSLGIYGFGGSAHLALQLARHEGARVHVATRSSRGRALALELGADSVATPGESPPGGLDSAILFAPAGELVPVALRALRSGGRLAIAGIHLSPIPALDYDADLFHEREVVSVTANTRADGEAFLGRAAAARVRVVTTAFSFEDAPRALEALKRGELAGAAILQLP
jgi:propanol-preferring alcohol dehydrogenase